MDVAQKVGRQTARKFIPVAPGAGGRTAKEFRTPGAGRGVAALLRLAARPQRVLAPFLAGFSHQQTIGRKSPRLDGR